MRMRIEVDKLILLIENGLTIKEISEEFGVSISTIHPTVSKHKIIPHVFSYTMCNYDKYR